MIRNVLHAAFALALVLGMSLAHGQEARRLDELMRKSGLWVQVGQIHAQVKAGTEASRKEPGAAPLSNEDFKLLLAAIDFAFAPDRLRAGMSERIGKLLPPGRGREVRRDRAETAHAEARAPP